MLRGVKAPRSVTVYCGTGMAPVAATGAMPVPQYTVTDLGALTPRSINNAGQVAGVLGLPDVNHACIWENGALRDLGLGTERGSEGNGVNAAGQVTGTV